MQMLETTLPTALKNNQAASAKLIERVRSEASTAVATASLSLDKADASAANLSAIELSELGSLMLEQARFEQEVEVQHKRLGELRDKQLNPAPFDPAHCTQHIRQTTLHVPYGSFCLGGVHYNLVNLRPIPCDLLPLVIAHESAVSPEPADKKQRVA
jgi:hypothetical protein